MYLGNIPATSFETVQKDRFTGVTGTTVTLSHAVSSVNDILCFVNSVKQDYTNYSVNLTTLTLGGTLVASDIVEVCYVGRTFQTVNPSAGSVGTSQLASTAVTPAKMDLSQDYTFTGKVSGHMSPAFHAFLNSSQSTSHSTFATLICNSEIFDSNSAYDVSNGRFTPQKAGKYFAYANIHWESMETGTTVELEIRKNGSRSGETNLIRRNSRAGDQSIFSSIIIDMNGSSDFLTLGGLQNSGFTKNAEGGTSFQATYFGAYRIGD